MRRTLIALLDIVVWVAIVAATVAGVVVGGKFYPQWARQSDEFDWSHGLAGGFGALVVAVAVFGAIAVLIQIEENTRRNSDIFGALVRRAEHKMQNDGE